MLLTQQLCGILCGGSAIWGQYLLFVASSYNKEVYFIIWWANFHFVFKPPAAIIISILSVAFSVIYSEWNLAKSPLLSRIGRKFFKFFARGALPPSMTFLTGLNAFVCRFLVSDWLSLLCICQKPHRFADKLSEPAREPVCSACFATFCYFIQVIKQWNLVNVDDNVKIQFSLIFSFTFNLSLTNSQLSLSIF